ncbi:hypothetical protein ACOMHN_000580 [Nucella lapillus]
MNTPAALSEPQTGGLNGSVPEGCVSMARTQRDFLPWNNSDNIVSLQTQVTTAQVRTNLLLLLSLIGGPANVINMAVFVRQGLKDRVNLLLFSLSLADEVYMAVCVLHVAEEFVGQFRGVVGLGPLYTLLVNVRLTALQAMCFVSFVLTAVIACERCYCVLRPLNYRTALRTRTVAVIIVVLFLVIPGVNFFLVSRFYISCVYDSGTGVAKMWYVATEFYLRHTDVIDYLESALFGLGLPVLSVVVVTAATIVTVWKLRQTVQWRLETAAALSAKEVALTKMLIGTSVLLVACLSPVTLFHVVRLFLSQMGTGRRNENFFLTCLWIAQMCSYVNSSFNICVYFAMGSRYRETFWSLFGRKTEPGKTLRKTAC